MQEKLTEKDIGTLGNDPDLEIEYDYPIEDDYFSRDASVQMSYTEFGNLWWHIRGTKGRANVIDLDILKRNLGKLMERQEKWRREALENRGNIISVQKSATKMLETAVRNYGIGLESPELTRRKADIFHRAIALQDRMIAIGAEIAGQRESICDILREMIGYLNRMGPKASTDDYDYLAAMVLADAREIESRRIYIHGLQDESKTLARENSKLTHEAADLSSIAKEKKWLLNSVYGAVAQIANTRDDP